MPQVHAATVKKGDAQNKVVGKNSETKSADKVADKEGDRKASSGDAVAKEGKEGAGKVERQAEQAGKGEAGHHHDIPENNHHAAPGREGSGQQQTQPQQGSDGEQGGDASKGQKQKKTVEDEVPVQDQEFKQPTLQGGVVEDVHAIRKDEAGKWMEV